MTTPFGLPAGRNSCHHSGTPSAFASSQPSVRRAPFLSAATHDRGDGNRAYGLASFLPPSRTNAATAAATTHDAAART